MGVGVAGGRRCASRALRYTLSLESMNPMASSLLRRAEPSLECVLDQFSIECVLYRACCVALNPAYVRVCYRMCSLQNVFFTECVLYRMCSLQNVFFTECVLYRMCFPID